jgi:DNA-binding MarR family transcriptional regulator
MYLFSFVRVFHIDSVLSIWKQRNNKPMSAKSAPPATEIIPLFVADVFHLAGGFRRLGDRIAETAGYTQAQWQLLSAASVGPRTVAQLARRLGYARQSVQRTADQLIADGLACYSHNPDHKASPLLELTDEGVSTLARITKAARKWHLALAGEVNTDELNIAFAVVRKLCDATEKVAARRLGLPESS